MTDRGCTTDHYYAKIAKKKLLKKILKKHSMNEQWKKTNKLPTRILRFFFKLFEAYINYIIKKNDMHTMQ